MASQVWLVTGATSGIGAALVKGIVAHGDKVIATGRNAESRIANLASDTVTILDLDVSASKASVDAQIKKAVEVHGRIDVLVNNAGMSGATSIEEATEEFTRNIFDVNLFGALKVTQAVLPYMRSQQSGHVTFIGAGLSWAPFPFLGLYSMTKAALNSKFICNPSNISQTNASNSARRSSSQGGLVFWHKSHHVRARRLQQHGTWLLSR